MIGSIANDKRDRRGFIASVSTALVINRKEDILKILVACEYSGVVRRAFEAKGHDVISCDLLPADDNSPYHYQGPVEDMLAEGGKWDLMIAHPPCTYLCSSGLHWNGRTPGRAEKTEESLKFVQMLMNADIPKIAVENPVGCIGTRIRKPDQFIQPHEYGHDASKRTCLWLKGLEPLKPTQYVEPRWVCCDKTLPEGVGKHDCPNCNGEKTAKPRWSNQTDSGQNKLTPSDTRWKERSKTYEGWAAAMAEQWG